MAVLGTTLLPNRIALACIDDRNQRESETRRREQQLESRNYGIARFCRQLLARNGLRVLLSNSNAPLRLSKALK
jgi:hypothetical protein